MTDDLVELTKASLITQLEEMRDAVRAAAEPLSDTGLWAKPVQPGNSVGHLILHLTGNLNHFVGAQLGGTGYRRDREREFTETHPPSRDQLLAGLDDAVATFRRLVGGLDAGALARPHPEARFGAVLSALIQLLTHFSLHRGQISYLARLVKPRV